MKIFLNRVIWRDISEPAAVSFDDLLILCERKGVEYERYNHVGDGLVSRARSVSATRFLRTQCDVLLSLDSDIIFHAQDTLKICEEALHENTIVGGLYMTRALNATPAIALPMDRPIRLAPDGKLVEVPYLNTGFLAVPRTVFESLIPDMPKCVYGEDFFYPFYQPMVVNKPLHGGDVYLSEDWSLCQRARDKGFKMLLDPSVPLRHVGSYEYALEDLLRPARPDPQPLVMEVLDKGTRLHVQLLGSLRRMPESREW